MAEEAAAPAPTPGAQTDKAVVRRMTRDATDLTSPARYGWEPEQVEALKHTVAKDCTPAEFVMFLELSARYRLDPFARQIWAAKMGSDQPVAILVGRDGLLAVCERYDTFDGMDSDVVVEGDKLTRDPENGEYVHEWGDQHLTGKIIGAWSMVWRTDRRRPICFYARFSEYAKENSKFWKKFQSAMIVKCAESMAMKRAYTITGLLVEEEVSEYPEHGVISRAQSIEWGDDPRLAEWLQALVEKANAVRKNAYRPQKVLALLKGRTDDDRRAFAQELVDHIVNFDGDVPAAPSGLAIVEDRQITWEDTIDADVVPGDEDPDAPTDLPELGEGTQESSEGAGTPDEAEAAPSA